MARYLPGRVDDPALTFQDVMQVSEVVQKFIATHITSVDQLEILLLLKRSVDSEWTAETVSRTLFTEPEAVRQRLRELAADGLLTKKAGEDSYRYSPQTPELDRAVTELERDYPKFRVSIINLIFSKPIDRIRTFADAFRLKHDDKGGK